MEENTGILDSSPSAARGLIHRRVGRTGRRRAGAVMLALALVLGSLTPVGAQEGGAADEPVFAEDTFDIVAPETEAEFFLSPDEPAKLVRLVGWACNPRLRDGVAYLLREFWIGEVVNIRDRDMRRRVQERIRARIDAEVQAILAAGTGSGDDGIPDVLRAHPRLGTFSSVIGGRDVGPAQSYTLTFDACYTTAQLETIAGMLRAGALYRAPRRQ